MLKNNEKNYYQNLCVLALIVVLFSLVLGATVQNAKNSEAILIPTPTPKKSPTPKKTPTPTNSNKKASNTNSNKTTSNKSSNSNKTTSNSNKSTSNSNKKSNSNSKSTSNSNKSNTNSNKSSSNSNKSSSNSNKNSNKSTKSSSNSNKSSSNSNKSSSNSNKSSSNSNKSSSNSNKSSSNSNKSNSNSNKSSSNSTAVSYPQVIVTSVSARVRSQASSSSPEVRRVKLGTLLKVTNKQSGWYQVQIPSTGKTSSGWISISSADDFDSANREEVYRQVADKYYKDEMDFNTAAELFDFLSRASDELKSKNIADLELKRLLSLRASLALIPFDNITKAQKDFLKANENKVIYSEPAGTWYVRSELFWDLHKKYKDTKNGDNLAWIATQNPLPGECEGYVNCYLFILRATDGEYLNLYPTGEHADDAVKHITDMLEPIMQDLKEKTVYNGPTDVSDRAEFNRLIAELRSILSKLATTDKDKPIQQLEAIAEAFR